MGVGARARFRVVRNSSTSLTIKDLGPWDEHPTVTNDAAAVVAELHDRGFLMKRRLYYYDSEGALAELAHKDGRFAGFKPLSRRELDRRQKHGFYVAEEGSELAKVRERMQAAERRRIRAAIRAHDACLASAAAELGLSRGGLHYRMKALGMLSARREST